MTTAEKNAAIARWMGLQESSNETYPVLFLPIKDSDEWFAPDELKYHSDWNWLCLAVEKIENTSYEEDKFYNVTIGYGLECTIQGGKVDICKSGQTKIEAVHEAVYQFVVWHNQQQKL